MKFIMKKRLYFAAIILSMFFAAPLMTSCSSDDGNTSEKGNEDDENNDEDNGTTYFVHKAILEDFTSIGCVACPIGAFVIEEIEQLDEYKNRIIPVAIHDDFNYEDPFRIPAIATAYKKAMFGNTILYPSLFWNRNPRWEEPGSVIDGEYDENGNPRYFLHEEAFVTYLNTTNYLKEKSNIGIKITSELAETSGIVSFSLKFSEDIDQPLKYIVYILEDDLAYRQANSTPLYGNTTGQARWEMNFVHHSVLRAANNIMGEEIDTIATAEEEILKDVNLEYESEAISNLKVVVAILDENGIVLNAQVAKANTTQDYEVIE